MTCIQTPAQCRGFFVFSTPLVAQGLRPVTYPISAFEAAPAAHKAPSHHKLPEFPVCTPPPSAGPMSHTDRTRVRPSHPQARSIASPINRAVLLLHEITSWAGCCPDHRRTPCPSGSARSEAQTSHHHPDRHPCHHSSCSPRICLLLCAEQPHQHGVAPRHRQPISSDQPGVLYVILPCVFHAERRVLSSYSRVRCGLFREHRIIHVGSHAHSPNRDRNLVMQAILSQATVVVAGSWNMGIFSPEWVSDTLLEKENVDLEVAFSLPFVMTPRFKSKKCIVIPATSRLTIGLTADVHDWKLAVTVALRALRTLNHTPVTAVGVNFGFEVNSSNLPDKLSRLFAIADEPCLFKHGFTVNSRDIVRNLSRSDCKLNLKTSLTPESIVKIHLNYNRDCANTAAAEDFLESVSKGELRNESLALLAELYDLNEESAHVKE